MYSKYLLKPKSTCILGLYILFLDLLSVSGINSHIGDKKVLTAINSFESNE